MGCTTSNSTKILASNNEKQIDVVPRPLKQTSERPVIVVLIPEVDDPMYAQRWQPSFDQCAPLFKAAGADVIAAPWSTTPLPTDLSYSFVYVANLTWGYHFVPDRWNAWLRAWPKNARLINSVKLLMWNTRKTYLRDLETCGIPVIPTLYTDGISVQTLNDAAAHFSANDLIVKPQISACSFNMVRVLVNSDDFSSASKSMSISAAVAELERLGALHSPMMIQPFMPSICEEGEISVLVFGDKVSHVVKKNARSDDFRVQAQNGGIFTTIEHPTSEMLELALAAIHACPEKPIYSRVDMIRNNVTGRLCVIELELIEPDLYLNHMNDGGAAFTREIMAHLFN